MRLPPGHQGATGHETGADKVQKRSREGTQSLRRVIYTVPQRLYLRGGFALATCKLTDEYRPAPTACCSQRMHAELLTGRRFAEQVRCWLLNTICTAEYAQTGRGRAHAGDWKQDSQEPYAVTTVAALSKASSQKRPGPSTSRPGCKQQNLPRMTRDKGRAPL